MNVTSHQEKRRIRRQRRAREGQEKRENRRPILKKLCAAFSWSFRGSIAKKYRGVPGVTGTLGKPNNPKWDRGLHYHVEAAVETTFW